MVAVNERRGEFDKDGMEPWREVGRRREGGGEAEGGRADEGSRRERESARQHEESEANGQTETYVERASQAEHLKAGPNVCTAEQQQRLNCDRCSVLN